MKPDLLKYVSAGGCSAKIPPAMLEAVLSVLPGITDTSVLVGITTHDDAGVYKISDELALVLTTDFFPPVCSDPYEYGQIAAANSLSDVYAMGAKPVVALNIMMFPAGGLSPEVYADILRGGHDKAAEAGVSIIGGHTIDDQTPKYGLSVTGLVHPGKIISNAALKPGDVLILTKPVGTGTILTAAKLGMADEEDVASALGYMKMLNNKASEAMVAAGARAATDITGFGFAGHALKMAKASQVSVYINLSAVPVIGNVISYINDGCIPGASFRNLEYAEPHTAFADNLNYNYRMLAFDAQTSGGLLIGIARDKASSLVEKLKYTGHNMASVIGFVGELNTKYLYLNNC